MELPLPSRAERAAAVSDGYVTWAALPDVRGRSLVGAAATGITIIGLAVAIATNTPEAFARVGNLIALVAAAFAYYGACSPQAVDRWIEASMSLVDIDAQIVWDRYNEDSGVAAAKKPAPISTTLLVYLAALGGIEWPREGAAPTQLDYWNVLNGLTKSRSGREKLVNDLNESLHSLEFKIVAFGVVVSTVGDWVLKPLIDPLWWFLHLI